MKHPTGLVLAAIDIKLGGALSRARLAKSGVFPLRNCRSKSDDLHGLGEDKVLTKTTQVYLDNVRQNTIQSGNSQPLFCSIYDGPRNTWELNGVGN
jgi:hypothetical protein